MNLSLHWLSMHELSLPYFVEITHKLQLVEVVIIVGYIIVL